MISVNEKECEYVGLVSDDVEKIVKGIAKYAKMADKLGLQIFAEGTGGKGSASLRFRSNDRADNGDIVVAHITDGNWDGGDGATREDDNGILRGEI